ncbi:MAG: ATP-binding cassette domain-containing protein [Phycisphaerales bacterium]
MSRVKVHPPSRALRHACACFGIDPDRRHIRRGHAARRAAARALADQLLAALRTDGTGGVVFVTGPSGCGKSTFLAAVAARLNAHGAKTAVVRPHRRSRRAPETVIDAIVHAAGRDRSLEDALGVLARAGLAEAPLLARRVHELSEGQRWRLALAEAMARVTAAGNQAQRTDNAEGERKEGKEAVERVVGGTGGGTIEAQHTGNAEDRVPGGTVLLIDEFASTLDRVTARNLARTVRRWAGRAGVRVIAAAANDDVLEALAPDVLVAMTSRGTGTVTTKETADARTPS